jgi:DNA-binding LacI/PurR family transcriptional regulator
MAVQRPSTRPRPGGRPTLDEVATRAGVGRGTVSRVVNGSTQVSETTRAAVEQAISDLGYVPNRAARALVTQRTDAVALVICEEDGRAFGEPVLAGIIRGVSAALLPTPLQFWLAICQSADDRDRLLRHLSPQYVDGVLFLSVLDDDPLPALLVRRGLAVVRLVGLDNEALITGPSAEPAVATTGAQMVGLLLTQIRGGAAASPAVLDARLVSRATRSSGAGHD